MTDLIKVLPAEDKKTLLNYITHYGVKEETFIGLDEWLQNWNHSNQRLYKLLGNKLIYKIPYQREKCLSDIYNDIELDLLLLPFVSIYIKFIYENIENLEGFGEAFQDIRKVHTFLDDKISKPIKIKKPQAKKILQLQVGTKPIKALSKIIKYYDEEFKKIDPNYEQYFEEFRLKHSMIMNDKILKGNMVISIHPLDYLTMSDNSLNWSSCMSWTTEGCYRVGTIEMMNSNNVLCCYLEDSKKDYVFIKTNNDKYNRWSNKKWRTLVYITNDIIMGGKSYPYFNETMTKYVISIVKDLALKNLNRKYSFGPELYKDMIHINTNNAMNRNRYWLEQKDPFKKNIIWDTKGMYNDMLNSNVDYWCYRNKVKHKKIISVSGKAPCLCCGNSIIVREEFDNDDYNDRYDLVSEIICGDCALDFTCSHCKSVKSLSNFYKIKKRIPKTGNIVEEKLCQHCFDINIKYCPCCGKIFNVPDMVDATNLYWAPSQVDFSDQDSYNFFSAYSFADEPELYEKKFQLTRKHIEHIIVCDNCISKVKENYPHQVIKKKKIFFYNYKHVKNKDKYQLLYVFEGMDFHNKFNYFNYKTPPYPEDDILDLTI